MSSAHNLQAVQEAVSRVAEKCGRNPTDIQVVAVTTQFPVEVIRAAIDAGHTLFGENYIQEAELKIGEIGTAASFHFIGHLQSNKAKIAARLFDVIETVDSVKLARILDTALDGLSRTIKILVQVNVAKDERKAGVAAEDLEKLLRDIQPLRNLHVVGLMTMPPLTLTPEEARPHFRGLAKLAREMAGKGLFAADHKVELSMGMSGDYPVAIEEGATIIRIGTAIFGERHY